MTKQTQRAIAMQRSIYSPIDWYVLKHRKPVKVNFFDWISKRRKFSDSRVRCHHISDDVVVSTVFLNLDMDLSLGDKPLVFETAIITKQDFDIIGRCRTWREALRLQSLRFESLQINEG